MTEYLMGKKPIVINPDLAQISGKEIFGDLDMYRGTFGVDSEGTHRKLIEGQDFVRDPTDPTTVILSGGRRVPLQTL